MTYYILLRNDRQSIIIICNWISIISADDAVDIDHLNIIISSSKEVDGIRYYLENDMIIGDKFGRLCAQKSDGTELVFYDATELHNARNCRDFLHYHCPRFRS